MTAFAIVCIVLFALNGVLELGLGALKGKGDATIRGLGALGIATWGAYLLVFA